MIAIAGTIDFDSAESRDAAVAASAPLQRATREDEPGCIFYSLGADPVVDTRIQVFELWADAASLEAHFVHDNYFATRTLLRGSGMTSSDNRKYRIDAEAPVYDADHIATAEF